MLIENITSFKILEIILYFYLAHPDIKGSVKVFNYFTNSEFRTSVDALLVMLYTMGSVGASVFKI